jgi:hypothetical protein
VMGADGSGQTRVSRAFAITADWSPDGRSLVFDDQVGRVVLGSQWTLTSRGCPTGFPEASRDRPRPSAGSWHVLCATRCSTVKTPQRRATSASAAWSSAPLPERTSSTNWTASPPAQLPGRAALRQWPELACQAMADWAGGRGGLWFIPPGQPWRNGYVESCNSRIRDEWLNSNSFWSLAQARVVISDWKEDDNHRRRHRSLGDQAPAAYPATCAHR